jgi:hypothetical protein
VYDDQAGTNEAVGVKVRYYLANNLADTTTQELQLVFFEPDGDTIITYSSLYDTKRSPLPENRNAFYKNTKKPEGGKLNAQKGMHEFVWDMTYPEGTADTSATFDGSIAGPTAVPGKYIVKMFIADELIGAQECIIKNDPRNTATLQDLQAQFDLNKKIIAKVSEISKATKQIREVKQQIETYLSQATDTAKVHAFKKVSDPLIDSLNAISETLYAEKIVTFYDNLKYPVRIEEKLTALNDFLQTADTAPTKSMVEKYEELAAAADAEIIKLNTLLETEVNKLNMIAGEQKKNAIEVEE